MKNLKEMIFETDFKIIISKNKIDIINYIDIIEITNQKIILKYELGSIIINGDNLAVAKMVDDEILITGKIISVNL